MKIVSCDSCGSSTGTGALRYHTLRITLLVCICGALFINTLPGQFATWADTSLIVDSQYIKDWKNIPLFFTPHFWNHQHHFQSQGHYRPLRTTLFALDYRLWKQNPAGYHLTNLLLHTLNTVLVYFFVGCLGLAVREEGKARRFFVNLPLLTALFFAAHPVHTETVAFVKNRDELLTCLFFLLSCIFFIACLQRDTVRSAGIACLLSLICCGLAFLSKEMALTLPLVITLYGLQFSSAADRLRSITKTLPFWGGLLLFFWFRQTFLETAARIGDPVFPAEKVMAGLKTLGYHFYLLLFPVQLNVMHAFSLPRTFFTPDVFLPALAIPLLFAAIIVSYNKSKFLSFGISWLLLTQLPAVSLAYQAARPVTEQRLYLPSIGFCLILAILVGKLHCSAARFCSRGNRLFIFVLLLVLFAYGAQTIQRNRDWKDKISLWQDCVRKSPEMAIPHNILGLTRVRQGEFEKAAVHYKKALEILRNQSGENFLITADIYNNLGVACGMKKDFAAAERYFFQALKLRRKNLGPGHPETAQTMGNLGLLYYYRKDYGTSLHYLQQAQAVLLEQAGEGRGMEELQKIRTILSLLFKKQAQENVPGKPDMY